MEDMVAMEDMAAMEGMEEEMEDMVAMGDMEEDTEDVVGTEKDLESRGCYCLERCPDFELLRR